MKTTDLVVCLSLIGVTAEPAHDFNISVMSEGKKARKKDTGQLRCKATLYIHPLTFIHSQINLCSFKLLKYNNLSNCQNI